MSTTLHGTFLLCPQLDIGLEAVYTDMFISKFGKKTNKKEMYYNSFCTQSCNFVVDVAF